MDTPPVVVFDFDGTLVLSNAIKHDAFAWTADAHGLDAALLARIRAERPAANRHAIFAAFADRLAAAGVADAPAGPTLAATYGELCTRAIATCAWVPGAEAALDGLAARGMLLFINSATPTDGLRPAVEARGIAHRFAGILGGPQNKRDNLRAIACETGAPVDGMLMVGDGDDDRRAARAFGCVFVGVELADDHHGRPNHPFAEPPARVLSDLSMLPALVDRLFDRHSASRA